MGIAKRYILVKIVYERTLTKEQFHEAVANSVKQYFGELGLSRIDPRIMKFDVESLTAVISCERSATSELESALSLVTGYAEMPISLLVLRVSGTIKGAAKGKK